MDLRAWITQEIKKRNWSQRELARRTGLSQSLVQKTLKGEREPSLDFCVKVAQALGETPEKLLRMSGILPEIDEVLELFEVINTLNQEQRLETLKYIKFLKQNS